MSYDADWERPGATERANKPSNLDSKVKSTRIPRKLTRKKIKDAAKAMEDEPSLDPRKSCTGIFCRLFSGGKRRTKKRRKKRRTKSRRKTKRRRKSRRRTKRRRRKK